MDLLKQERGLTLLTGGKEKLRNALFTAMAHAVERLPWRIRKRIAGIDLNRPSACVPAQGITYIDSALNQESARRLVVAKWPKILTSTAPVLFLNGVWSAIPELGKDIVRSAATRNVTIAEEVVPCLE